MADKPFRMGGDGRGIRFPDVPWHRAGKCPVMGEPCACKVGSYVRSLCVDMAARNEKDPGEPGP